MKKIFFSLLIILILTPIAQGELYWDGRFYEQAMLIFRQDQTLSYLGFSMLDLKLDARPSDLVRVQSEMQYALLHQNNNLFLQGNGNNGVNVNTLKATINPGDFKITIGRFLPP